MGFGVGVGARGSQLFYLACLWRMDGGGGGFGGEGAGRGRRKYQGEGDRR